MENLPRVLEEDRSLFVEFSNGKRSGPHTLEMILDFGEQGGVVGIEILDWALSTGKNSLTVIAQTVPTNGDGLRYSYDAESDSFYLRLKAGRSLDQKAIHGFMCCDDRGQVVALSAEWA